MVSRKKFIECSSTLYGSTATASVTLKHVDGLGFKKTLVGFAHLQSLT